MPDPVPPELRAAFADPSFWEGLYRPDLELGHRYARQPSGAFEVAIDEARAIRIEVESDDMGVRVGLGVVLGGDASEIGGNLAACGVGSDLRWEELERLARVIALREPALPHPGPIVALLAPFAPLCVDDPARRARATLYEAFSRLGDIPRKEVDRWHRPHDGRGALFRWVHVPGFGWTPDPERAQLGQGMAMSSLRCAPDPELPDEESPFPAALFEALDASLSAQLEAARGAEPTVGLARALESERPLEQAWAIETRDGLPMGREGDARCSEEREPRAPVYRYVDVTKKFEKGEDDRTRGLLFKMLDNLLEVAVPDLDWGRWEGSSAIYGENRRTAEASVTFKTARSDWRIVELASEWAAWLGIRNGSARVSRTDESVPLTHRGPGRVVRLARFRCTWQPDSSIGPMAWYHQEPLREAERAVLLRHAPTEERWARVELGDGGRLKVHGRTPEYEGPGVTIQLESWTPDAARWLLRVMREAELTLLPQVISNTDEALARGLCPLPGSATLKDPDALYRLIAGGPPAWWERRPPHLEGDWWRRVQRWGFEWSER